MKALKAHAKQFASTGKLRVRTTKHHLPRAFGRLGPAQKIKVLQASAMAPRILDRFVVDDAKANLLKQVRGPLPGMASAYRRYTAFCELRQTPPFPVSKEVVPQRISVFNNSATFGNYVSLLEKCCFFLLFPTTWLTSCVRHAVKGLKKCQDRSFRFSNFIRIRLMTHLIEFESMDAEFAQPAFLSFLFACRVPSDTLCLARSFPDDPLGAFSPQPGNPLIGARVIAGESCLFPKLPRRKNLETGCILRRPCFCALHAINGSLLCPVHAMWPAIRRRVAPGSPSSRQLTGGTSIGPSRLSWASFWSPKRHVTAPTPSVWGPLKN